MTKIFMFLALLFLSACAGKDKNTVGNGEPKNFDITEFNLANDSVSTQDLTGTWVANWQIKRFRSEMVNGEISPTLHENRLEVFIIRKTEDNNYEASFCSSDFEQVSIEGNLLLTKIRQPQIINNKEMRFNSEKTDIVRLFGSAQYKEESITSVHYKKVSDQTSSFGTINHNWSDKEGSNTQDIFCAQVIYQTEKNYSKITLSDSNGYFLYISNIIDPTVVDAIITDPNHDNIIMNHLASGVQNFNFNEEGPLNYSLNFYAETNGLSTSGNAQFKIPVTR